MRYTCQYFFIKKIKNISDITTRSHTKYYVNKQTPGDHVSKRKLNNIYILLFLLLYISLKQKQKKKKYFFILFFYFIFYFKSLCETLHPSPIPHVYIMRNSTPPPTVSSLLLPPHKLIFATTYVIIGRRRDENGYAAVRRHAHILIRSRKEKEMDIRIINSEGEVINATNLHLMARNVFFIGLTENMEKEIPIERCRSKEEAITYLDAVKDAIKVGQEEQLGSVLIDLECKGEEDGK